MYGWHSDPRPSIVREAVRLERPAGGAWLRLALAAVTLGVVAGVPAAAVAGDAVMRCAETPRVGCTSSVVPERARLIFRNRDRSDRDKMVWKWLSGGATDRSAFGSPVTTDDYALCVYDHAAEPPALAFEAVVPAGGTCGARACWRPVGDRGFKYRNGAGTPEGITKVRLIAGADGRARILVKGRGGNLAMPSLPLGLPARTQLQAESGACWEAIYWPYGVVKNNAKRFGGTAGPDVP
jgi:hypothetical protein